MDLHVPRPPIDHKNDQRGMWSSRTVPALDVTPGQSALTFIPSAESSSLLDLLSALAVVAQSGVNSRIRLKEEINLTERKPLRFRATWNEI